MVWQNTSIVTSSNLVKLWSLMVVFLNNFGFEAFGLATWFINRQPSSEFCMSKPMEVLTSQNPPISTALVNSLCPASSIGVGKINTLEKLQLISKYIMLDLDLKINKYLTSFKAKLLIRLIMQSLRLNKNQTYHVQWKSK